MDLLLVPVALFDRGMSVTAYQFRYQADAGEAVDFSVLDLLQTMKPETFSADKPLLVPIQSSHLLSVTLPFAPEQGIVLWEDIGDAQPAYLSAIRNLRDRGYQIAVQGMQRSSVLRLADYLLLDHATGGGEPPALKSLAHAHPGLCLAAVGLPDAAALETARAVGYHLFEGPFFTAPITRGKHAVTPLKTNLIRLLNLVRDDNFEFEQVARIVQGDPALAVSLMRFINSPFLGIRNRVRTIHHAVVILGQQEVRKWVTAAVFKSLGSDRPGELTRLSLIRAKFAENLAECFHLAQDRQSLFLTGLFSVLDLILDVEMPAALSMVSVSEEIHAALLQRSGPYHPVLDCMVQYERANWQEVLYYCDRLSLPRHKISAAYLDALGWYNALLTDDVRPSRPRES